MGPSPPPSAPGAAGTLAALGAPYARGREERWAPVPRELDEAIAADADLASVARCERDRLVRLVAARLGGMPAAYRDALLATPRERFVLPEDIAASADDVPLALDSAGQATVSAPHAYLLTFSLLDLRAGDHLLELGTGTGYGAALASAIVSAAGHVTTIEIAPDLAERARRLLASTDRVRVLFGDARDLAPRVLAAEDDRPNKIAVTYAMREVPEALVQAMGEGGTLVAPIGDTGGDQELVRYALRAGAIERSRHGAVRYVTER